MLLWGENLLVVLCVVLELQRLAGSVLFATPEHLFQHLQVGKGLLGALALVGDPGRNGFGPLQSSKVSAGSDSRHGLEVKEAVCRRRLTAWTSSFTPVVLSNTFSSFWADSPEPRIVTTLAPSACTWPPSQAM